MNNFLRILLGLAIVGVAGGVLLAKTTPHKVGWLIAAGFLVLFALVDEIKRYRASRLHIPVVDMTDIVAELRKPPPPREGVDVSDIAAELSKPRVDQVLPENVQHPDPLARAAIAKAFNEGGFVIGERKADGEERIEKL